MAKGSVPFFQTKVAMAVIGVVLIGGTSAVLAARTVNEPSVVQTTNAVSAHASGTSQNLTSTSTKSKATATAKAKSSSGQTITLSGRVRSVSTTTNTFILVNRSGSHTIDVNSGTTFTGAATSFGGLQVGMDALVTGKVQSDRSCLASRVDSDAGN
jgi:hypothetical protein